MDNGYEGGSVGYAPTSGSDFSNNPVSMATEESFASSGEFYIEGEPVVSEYIDTEIPETVSEETHTAILEDVKMHGIEATLQAIADGKYLDEAVAEGSVNEVRAEDIDPEPVEEEVESEEDTVHAEVVEPEVPQDEIEEKDLENEEDIDKQPEEQENLEQMLEEFKDQHEEIMNELEELGLELDDMLEHLKKLIEVIAALKEKLEEVTQLYNQKKEELGEDDPTVQHLAVLIEQIKGFIAKIIGPEGGEQ